MASFYCPTKVYTGPDSLQTLAQYHARRVLVVTDAFFSQNGTAQEIAAWANAEQVRIFDRVKPDPEAALAVEGAAMCVRFSPDLLIALGGGSAMDCAKAIMLTAGASVRFIAIPTTSGSGSEMTSFSILTHGNVKHPLVDPALRPEAAILHESLLQQLPRQLIADTGFDLLAHCIEALTATGRSAFTDALALHAAATVVENLQASYCGDIGVRLSIHEAASMAGLAFDQAGLGVCHALAHALGGAFHVAHGRLCAMLLPHVMKFNAAKALGQYVCLARRLALPTAAEGLALRKLIGAVSALARQLHMPADLGQAGVTPEQWRMQKTAVLDAAMDDPCCRTNPVPVTRNALEQLCKAVEP